MAAEIFEEKNSKATKKVREREAAMKIIKDNLIDKKKRMADLDTVKRKD